MRALVLLFAMSLAGCGLDQPVPEQEDSTPPAADQQAEMEQSSNVVEKAVPPRPEDPIPTFVEQLTANERGHFRFDRVRDAKGGGRERQVYVEMIGLGDVQSADIAAGIFDSLGLEAGRRWGDENGVRMTYSTGGGGDIRVLVRSREAHSRLERPDAESSVYLTLAVDE